MGGLGFFASGSYEGVKILGAKLCHVMTLSAPRRGRGLGSIFVQGTLSAPRG